jgi:hypothetical protein
MSFGLSDVLPKVALHQLQRGVWGAAATYTCVVRTCYYLSAHHHSISYFWTRSLAVC